MKGYKNLYINGCSFTAGHTLPEEKTWPVLLSKKLNLNLINQSKNGNSFQSIVFNSVNHLSHLDSKDTLVIIGTTYASRYMIQFKKGVVNITSGDLSGPKGKVKSESRLSTYRRFSSPYFISREKLNIARSDINSDEVEIVLNNFVRYYDSLIKYDTDLKDNQSLNLISNLILLQSFLKENNFNYGFVRPSGDVIDLHLPINKKLDRTRIIPLGNDVIDNSTKHPGEKGCIEISEKVYDFINR